MTKFSRMIQLKSLTRLITGASLGLTLLTVITVAQTPPDDQVSALSSTAANSSLSIANNNKSPASSNTGTTPPPVVSAPKEAPNNAKTSTSIPATGAAPVTVKPIANGKASGPNPSPAPAAVAVAPAGSWKYPLHTGIKTTWFYAGEPASADNDFIQNVSSAWQDDWQSHFGGSDNPASRCGYNPCGFTPHENPFYFALPFSDYTASGPVPDLSMVPWKTGPMADGTSVLKNRWIQITAAASGASKTVYAQWEDVGPFNEHDSAYVFGSAAPAEPRAGLDVSPATRDYLGMGGSTLSSWRFVDASEVPAGPWKTIVTSSAPAWN